MESILRCLHVEVDCECNVCFGLEVTLKKSKIKAEKSIQHRN